MISLTRPSREAVARFLEQQRDQPFTYPNPGATRNGEAPPLAFSRPRLWLVRLAYPMARRLQKRFAVESLARMERAVRERA